MANVNATCAMSGIGMQTLYSDVAQLVYGSTPKPLPLQAGWQLMNQWINSGQSNTYQPTSTITLNLALFSAIGTELSGSGYARQGVLLNGTNFQVNADGITISNKVAITFAAVTGSFTVTYMGFDIVGTGAIPGTTGGIIGPWSCAASLVTTNTLNFIIGALTIVQLPY